MKSFLDDIELVEKLQKSDVKAFNMIYSKYFGKLYKFGLKYIRSAAETMELVQSIFLKLWGNFKSFYKESSFKSYLFTISYNDICKRFRAMILSERLFFQKGNINKSSADPEKYNAWTGGILVFRSDSMTEVASRIERWYYVKIVLADKELERYSSRATFQDDPIKEVLRCQALTLPSKI